MKKINFLENGEVNIDPEAIFTFTKCYEENNDIHYQLYKCKEYNVKGKDLTQSEINILKAENLMITNISSKVVNVKVTLKTKQEEINKYFITFNGRETYIDSNIFNYTSVLGVDNHILEPLDDYSQIKEILITF